MFESARLDGGLNPAARGRSAVSPPPRAIRVGWKRKSHPGVRVVSTLGLSLRPRDAFGLMFAPAEAGA